MGRRKARTTGVPAAQRSTAAYDRSSLRQAIVWLVAAKVAGLILIFDPGELHAFDLPKSLYSRSIEWLLLGLIGLVLLRYGTGVVPRTRLHLAVLAFLAANAASAAVAENTYMALYGDWIRYLGLTFLLDMATLYAAVAIAFRRDADWLVLSAAVAVATLVSIGYALVQYAGADPIRWTADPRVRPFGTLGNPDQFGHLLAVVASASLAVAILSTRRPLRVAATAVAVAAIAAASLAATRAVVLGLGAGLLVLAVVWLRQRRGSGRGVRRAALALGTSIVVAAAILAITPLGTRLLDTARGAAVRDRVLIYESALRMFGDRPLLGFGPDNFGVAYLRYRQPGSEAIFNFQRHNSAHDWILQTAVTTGAVGLAALATLIAVFARSLWALSARKAVIGGALLAGLAAYWAQGLLTVGSISVDWSPWVAFGAAAAARGAVPAIGYRRRRAVGMHVAVAVAALIGAASVGAAFRASTDAKTAALQTQAGKGPAAVVAAASAVRLDPGRSEYWVQLGRARALAGSEREAGDAYAEATTRDPWNADYWQHLAASRARLAIAGDRSRGGA
ncbi:MAG: O-antigen ligase family protein, partial [Chloroflexota bacterium]